MKIPGGVTPRTQRTPNGLPFLRGTSGMDTQSGVALGNQLQQFGGAVGNVGALMKQQQDAAKRFGVMQSFSQFQLQTDERLVEMKRNADPAQANFADVATAEVQNWTTDWLKTVPDELHDEFQARAADVVAGKARDALAFQYESTDAYFRQGLSDQVNLSLIALDQDGSPQNLEAQRLRLAEMIATTSLTEAEKVARTREAYAAIEGVAYKGEMLRMATEGSGETTAADLIRTFGGDTFDENLDYETNETILEGRVALAEEAVVAELGDTEQWAMLPERAQAAVASLVDDLGGLPENVKDAILSGDLEAVAQSIAESPGDEGRRIEEAMLVASPSVQAELDNDPRFANVPYEDRLAIRAQASSIANAQAVADAKAQKAEIDAQINTLEVGLFDGNMGQYDLDQAREAGLVTQASDIKRLQGIIDDRNEGVSLVQSIQDMLSAGITVNPADEDHKKALNAWFGTEGQASLQTMDTSYVENVMVPAARTLGDMPTDAVGTLEGMARSQDPQKALFALDALSQLQQASPEAYNARTNEALAADVEYWQTAKDYYPAEEVLAAVRVGTTQEERTRRTMLMEEANQLIKDGTVNTDIIQQLAPNGGFMGIGGAADPVMAAGTANLLSSDYQTLFAREYARDGDQAKAEARAQKALARIWKTTEIGGKRTLMKYPPELAGYPTWNGSHDWINSQARIDMGLAEDEPFQLISDAQTQAEIIAYQKGEGPPPSYNAIYWNERGEITVPTGITGPKGQERYVPQRIFFQITDEMQQQKREAMQLETSNAENERWLTMYNMALTHSIATGVPVPQELQDEYEERTNATTGN